MCVWAGGVGSFLVKYIFIIPQLPLDCAFDLKQPKIRNKQDQDGYRDRLISGAVKKTDYLERKNSKKSPLENFEHVGKNSLFCVLPPADSVRIRFWWHGCAGCLRKDCEQCSGAPGIDAPAPWSFLGRFGFPTWVEMNPHDPDPEGQLVDPMSRKFSATHLEALDHFEHVKAGHRCSDNLAFSCFRSPPSLPCFGSTLSKIGPNMCFPSFQPTNSRFHVAG